MEENIECCIIQSLLDNNFSSRKYHQQLEIMTKGRPCPELPNLTVIHRSKGKDYTRHFCIDQYKSVPWLTGCVKLNKLFCWPCLLFSKPNDGKWTTHGYSDLSHLSAAQQKHERSPSHIFCFMEYKMFGKQKNYVLLNSQMQVTINKHNEEVKRNRSIFRRLTDAVCFLAGQELPFGSHDESEGSFNGGNYLEFLEVLRSYDPLLDSYLKTSTPDIQDDIIEAVSDVIIDKIKEEVNAATFVSIELDQTSDIIGKSQLSTVFRYVFDGMARERFVGFSDVISDRSASGLFNHLTSIVEEFQISDKLIGQTYDGASVMSGHLKVLREKVREEYPKAMFTHCYAHILNLVLQQSLCNIKECRIFFQTLSGLPAFFSKSSKQKTVFEKFVEQKLPSVAPLVHTTKEYRVQIIQFFQYIIDNSSEWDADTILKAQGFLSFLNDFDTVLLLEITSRLFSYTDVLYNILQKPSVDITYCSQKLNDTIKVLQDDRNEDVFRQLFSSAKEQMKEEDPQPQLIKRVRIEYKSVRYRLLYYEIIENIIQEIETRYGSLSKLEFFHLLTHQKFEDYCKHFPDKLIGSLRNSYGKTFDHIRLKCELTVIYVSAEFQGLPVFKIVEFLKNNDLVSGFKEVYKLAELILSLPCTISSVEESFSALKRIQTFCKSTRSQDCLNALGIISIERELLRRLRSNDSFYDLVLNKFSCKNRRMDLIYN